MKSNFFFHFFLFLFGFFIGNLFPTFFGQLIGSATSFFLLILFEFFHLIAVSGKPSSLLAQQSQVSLFRAWYSAAGKEKLRLARLAADRDSAMSGPIMPNTRIGGKSGEANYRPLQNFNSIKIGILFGLFVDAFKVGS